MTDVVKITEAGLKIMEAEELSGLRRQCTKLIIELKRRTLGNAFRRLQSAFALRASA
ncbi:hypothetical protein [Bradyrhizobium sp. UNPA324]|uniref:hypothetical protein n=1 Tax=Bradyrhizobium sp. UNPA324 TaxID=1141174 RepID=UPI0015EF4FFC|nr:hypothetical protein [Bradyrhizobium sp. UNPA324]